jgi:hypothetical protein
MCDTIVISKNLAAKVREPFGDKIRNKASMVIKDGTYAAAVKQVSAEIRFPDVLMWDDQT